jgi:hypothetical protein
MKLFVVHRLQLIAIMANVGLQIRSVNFCGDKLHVLPVSYVTRA